MSENTTATTELASQYASQVTTDLERNVEEQARLSAEIAALQEQLTTLQHDHTVLVNLQQALGLAPSAPAGPTATPAVPAPRTKASAAPETAKKPQAKKTSAAGRTRNAKSPSATASSTAARTTKASATTKSAAGKTAKSPASTAPTTDQATKSTASTASTAGKRAKAPAATPAKSSAPAENRKPAAPADRPTLVDLVREHLAEQSEPRSAAEIAATLGRTHTDRAVKPTVVRTTLEGLVAKGQAQRTRQGRSVFYTTPDAPEQRTGQDRPAERSDQADRTPATTESRTEDAA
ncbi:hypothetical protein ACIP10_30145 [Streptomyces galbus]|uniref:hypothetical protein n=1 Tax=Streptomyces galbus TaxID=33898 RepID=UPI0037BB650E